MASTAADILAYRAAGAGQHETELAPGLTVTVQPLTSYTAWMQVVNDQNTYKEALRTGILPAVALDGKPVEITDDLIDQIATVMACVVEPQMSFAGWAMVSAANGVGFLRLIADINGAASEMAKSLTEAAKTEILKAPFPGEAGGGGAHLEETV